jgi:hypothetical protein
MSRRLPPELLDDPPDPLLVLDEDDPDEPEELLVEYFVDVLDAASWVRTSVPNSVQSSHTSSSAPSIFTRFGSPTSVPHISHCTIAPLWHARA